MDNLKSVIRWKSLAIVDMEASFVCDVQYFEHVRWQLNFSYINILLSDVMNTLDERAHEKS